MTHEPGRERHMMYRREPEYMRPYKAVAAPPFEGRETWHGLYYHKGHWREVRNSNDLPIIYKTAQHAINAAKLVREQADADSE